MMNLLPGLKRLRKETSIVRANFTRPADTTTYAINDVICNSTSAPVVITFAGMARQAGKGGTIRSCVMAQNNGPTLRLDADLVLFDTSPTIQTDNAVWAPTIADLRNSVGVIAFSPGNFCGSSSAGVNESRNRDLDFECVAGSTSLYGILVARNAYVPANAERFDFQMVIWPD